MRRMRGVSQLFRDEFHTSARDIRLRLHPSWMVFGEINSPEDSTLSNTNDGQVYLKLLCFSSFGYLPALLHLQPMICNLVRG